MKTLRIYPYNMACGGARKLATALSALRVHPNRRYRPRAGHVILNWGNTQIPEWYEETTMPQWINHPWGVKRAVHKLECLELLQVRGVSVPAFTTSLNDAAHWLTEGHSVVERHLLNSHSGKGIKVKHPDETLEVCHFYTKYVGERREYRVHCFNDEAIYIQQKKRRNGVVQNDQVRNHGGGWVYAADDITPLSEAAIADAIKAVSSLGLVCGAVDIITRQGSHYVLEVNTAPGVEGDRSLEVYTKAISSYIACP